MEDIVRDAQWKMTAWSARSQNPKCPLVVMYVCGFLYIVRQWRAALPRHMLAVAQYFLVSSVHLESLFWAVRVTKYVAYIHKKIFFTECQHVQFMFEKIGDIQIATSLVWVHTPTVCNCSECVRAQWRYGICTASLTSPFFLKLFTCSEWPAGRGQWTTCLNGPHVPASFVRKKRIESSNINIPWFMTLI